MKRQLSLLISILICSNILSQSLKPIPAWVKEAYFYQVYPQSFKDTDGDGIGDLQGVIQKLDYIQWLGCNVIWINPCFESGFKDAGYDVIDYYTVAKRYGTNEDLKMLFEEARKRDIRICLDLVAGHTSVESPWFKASASNSENEFTDRYIWSPDTVNLEPKFVKSDYQRKGSYLKNYFDCQPALNYGYGEPDPRFPWQQSVDAPGPKATRAELMRIMDFWMDMGCDGFRIDMAGSLIKKDPDYKQTTKLWHEIRAHFQEKYPEGLLLAEWGTPKDAMKVGFMMDFIIHFRNSGYGQMFFNEAGTFPDDSCYFDLKGLGKADHFLKMYALHREESAGKGYICLPTSNHDFQRPHCGSRNTEDQLRTVMTFFLTQPGIPLIYYGDEIGMRFLEGMPDKEGSRLKKGNRAGSRTPMQWDRSKNAGFSQGDSSTLYLPVDPDPNYPNVQDAVNNNKSLLYFVKDLIALRKANQALGCEGDIRFFTPQNGQYPLIYERSCGNESWLIVINPTDSDHSLTLDYPLGNRKLRAIRTSHPLKRNKIVKSNSSLRLQSPPVSYSIYQIK